jgi:hypothetical protein
MLGGGSGVLCALATPISNSVSVSHIRIYLRMVFGSTDSMRAGTLLKELLQLQFLVPDRLPGKMELHCVSGHWARHPKWQN